MCIVKTTPGNTEKKTITRVGWWVVVVVVVAVEGGFGHEPSSSGK